MFEFFVTFVLLWPLLIIATAVLAGYKKLSVIGFGFLALFLGPLAFVIVLLVPRRQGKPDSGPQPHSLTEARRQLLSIKHSLAALTGRIAHLESVVNALSEADKSQELPVQERVTSEPKEVVRQEVPETFEGKKRKGEAFEFVFGKYWLNRIGIILCFLGLTFFIGYTFKHLNVLAKILIGYLASAAFFAWGHILERKAKYTKFAAGLLGGAWGFLYLATYAMHYIEATRIIHNPALALWLLVFVSFAAIFYNLKYRSWIITSLTFLLAFFTAGLGGIDYSTVFYCTLLTACIVYFSFRLQWHRFLLVSLCGVYLTYFWWIQPHIRSALLVTQRFSIPIYQFHLAFGVLLTSWLLFSAGLFLLKVDDSRRQSMVVKTLLLNAGFFIILGLTELYKLQPHLKTTWDLQYWFVMALAVTYFAYAFIYRMLQKEKLVVVNMAIAFTLLVMATLIKSPGLSLAYFWIFEMGILFALGLYYNERLYRILAYILTGFIVVRLWLVDFSSSQLYSFFFLQLRHHVIVFLFAALLFYLLGFLIRLKQCSKNIDKAECTFICVYFTIIGALLFTSIQFSHLTKSFYWLLQIVAVFIAMLYTKERIYKIAAAVLSSLLLVRLFGYDALAHEYYPFLFMSIKHNVLFLGVSALCFYCLRGWNLCRQPYRGASSRDDDVGRMLVIFATALITVVLWQEVAGKWLSSSLALEGLIILGVGFLLKDKVFRVSALVILSLACLRVFAVDLSGVDTIYRIIAFVFLGFVLLMASLVYSKLMSNDT